MTIFIILLFVAAGVLAYLGMYKMAAIAAGLAILIWVFSKAFSKNDPPQDAPLQSTNVGGVDVADDTCGCAPGQTSRVYKKNIFGKWKFIGLYPCALALGLVNKNSKKYSLRGCQ